MINRERTGFKGKIMSAIFEKATNLSMLMLECKHCHQAIAEHDTVAYHLVEGVLFGWCPACFSQRAPVNKTISEVAIAAAVRGPVASAAA